MPYIAAALSFVVLQGPAWGQSQKSISQNTGGECSPAVVSQGQVTITCTGLDRRQQEMLRRIPSLMDQLLKRSQSDRDQILAKLEEIVKLQKNEEARHAQRHLTHDQQTILRECLKITPGSFSIGAMQGDAEAYSYAQDWRNVFMAAEWKIEHKDIPIQIFMIGGGMWTGMRIKLHGTMIGTNDAKFIDGSPEKKFYECMENAHIPSIIIPYTNLPTGSVRIEISARPLNSDR
jgi:hypothetical protein